ncbi:Pentatricopeptide repeat-containing protein [Forsythia ovata]|uniref:Pentatricopeptide repeat-containing protein n=1 Tax=Forsythia ovata TaxID=205694 RepID=A0ABD1TT52_9LAMI
MHLLGIGMNQFTYGSILTASCALGSVVCGEQIYGFVVKNGFFFNGYVRAGMIDLFAKSCRFKDALRVFYDVSCDNVVCWNAVMSGAVKNNENWVALDIFGQMCRFGSLMPNGFTFSSVLTACAALEELELGKGVQGWVIKCGVGEDVFVGTTIVDLYAKCGAMDEAVKQFKQMPVRNVVSWTAIISGFVQHGDSVSAVWVFDKMKKMGEYINNFTITSVLAACAHLSMFKEAMQIHCCILKNGLYSDSVVKASLINMYSKIGAVNLSEIVFVETQNSKQLGVWTNMISAFAQNEISEKAINLFQIMLKEGMVPDKFSTSSILSIVECLTLGRQIHGYTLKAGLASDVSVGSSLFTMYSKCGNLEDSHKVFDQLEGKDNVSWASMIAGFAEHGLADKAILLFREMLLEEFTPDEMSLAAGLTACSALHSLKIGKEIHGFALRYGFGEQMIIDGALVNMYSKCGDLNSARIVFKLMPLKDQVSCSSLVSGYSQSGYIEEALQLLHEMLLSDLNIDAFTISSILGAVSLLNIPDIGTHLHARIIKMGVESEASVGSSLVMMYSKCGNIEGCSKVFQQIKNPDLVSWTTMITSYAQHGKGSEALHVYDIMRKSEIKPDSVTFVGILSACSHAGLVEEGYFHLNSMSGEYGIEPGYRHYACMVDLLGRAGRIEDAKRFISNMPIEPDALVWGTLLAACRVHGDIEIGKLAAEKIMDLGPSDAGAHVSLSNICADAGQWEDVLKVRASIKQTGVQKEPGWSSSV